VTAPPSRPGTLPDDHSKFSDIATDPSYRIIIDQVAAEKKAALEDPGPPWREWALHTAAKWYLGLGFLTVNGWIAGYFLFYDLYWPIAPLIALALYGEYLCWQYLWFRPETYRRSSSRHNWTSSPWIHPVPFGRWTPEADIARSGGAPASGQVDPSEFL